MKKKLVLIIGVTIMIMSLTACNLDTVKESLGEMNEELGETVEILDTAFDLVQDVKENQENLDADANINEVKDEVSEDIQSKLDKEIVASDDAKNIVFNAISNLGSYTMDVKTKIIMTYENKGSDKPDIFDTTQVQSDSTQTFKYDANTTVAYSSGETKSSVMGFETTTSFEQWIVNTEDGSISYQSVPGTSNFVKETNKNTNNRVGGYYEEDALFEIIDETNDNYIIRGILESVKDDTDSSVDSDDIDVLYTINKETNTITNITVICETDDDSLCMNMTMDIQEDDTISLELPKNIDSLVIDK